MCDYDMRYILNIVIKVLDVIHFFVPIVLIILCTIDIFKMIISKKEEDAKKYRNNVFRKIIYTIIIYLIPFLVPFVLGLVDKVLPMDYDSSWKECWNFVKDSKEFN